MSVIVPADIKQDATGAKCRIPLRASVRAKPTPLKTKITPDQPKNKADSMTNSHQPQRFASRNPNRLNTDERLKSTNRLRDELGLKWNHSVPHSARPERPERLMPAIKRPSTIPRRVGNEPRPAITGPISQRQNGKTTQNTKSGLPDQETIRRREDLELNCELEDSSDISGASHLTDKDSVLSRKDNLIKLKMNWQEHTERFEKMKSDLKAKQKAIMAQYAQLRGTHRKLLTMGQNISLPSSEDLQIMNVAQLTPEELLQVCSRLSEERPDRGLQHFERNWHTIDMNKLYSMPAKLAATCEETLAKRKEIIDWFEAVKTQNKGIQMVTLSKKLHDFSTENEILKCSLEQAKAEFVKELNEVVDFMRKSMNETMDLQLRKEELTCELSELNSQNADLRKQLHNSDNYKSMSCKTRLEELEKELKEEKCKKIVIQGRLHRAEAKVKMEAERAAQMDAALEQARSQAWSLERTVQQLHDQNGKLQTDFDKELIKLTESIRENTTHLEDIAQAREKLQLEKEDLEKRLKELSENYNESLKNTKLEMSYNVARLIETEKKNEQEAEDKKKLQLQVESMCAQLMESELAKKDALKLLQEKEEQLGSTITFQKELETTKRDLERAVSEIEDYRTRFIQQSEDIKDIERNFKESLQLEEDLRNNISTKDEYIAELEKKQILLEQQLEESESKMESYQKQLSSLKNLITQMKKDFGDFEDLDELHKIVNHQRIQLIEVTRQSGELAEVLRKKEKELEQHLLSLRHQENLLEQRENVIKTLSEKEEEHANIIKLLRNNLEIRAQADNDFNKQLSEKNAQINSLITNVETRKQQISQLEKIILTLEDQKQKANVQRKKDQDIINIMEQKILEYEALQSELKTNVETPTNIDSIIKILEDELGTPYELQIDDVDDIEHEFRSAKKYNITHHEREDIENFEYHKSTKKNKNMFQTENEKVPTKIVMGNFVKKTYMPMNDEQHKGDNLDRKKAITSIETQKWMAANENNNNMHPSPTLGNNTTSFRGKATIPSGYNQKENFRAKNIKFLAASQLRDEKRLDKLFKLTSHKL